MIFSAKVCPKAINFAIAESIHQLLVLRPHPTDHTKPTKTTALPTHLTYPPICPTHLHDISIHPDNFPEPTDNLPEPTDNLFEPTKTVETAQC